MYCNFASEILYLAKQAGEEVMKYYKKEIDVFIKEKDSSPFTNADLVANKIIREGLKLIDSNIPVLSEENSEHDNLKVKNCRIYWVVDPIDGTKSFINHSDEFTINIAMVEDGFPTGGVVYAPALSKAYFTAEDNKAYFQYENNLPDEISVFPVPDEGPVVITSMSHITPEVEEYVNSLEKISDYIKVASSLKFCLLAQGVAHIYPRFSRTMEWDTAAGQAVLEAAGGHVRDLEGNRFKYGKKDFINTSFLATAE